MKKILVLLFITCCYALTSMGQTPSIIPQPVQIITTKGQFALTRATIIVAAEDSERQAAIIFNDYLNSVYGFRLKIQKSATATNSIRLITAKSKQIPAVETYKLTVEKKGHPH